MSLRSQPEFAQLSKLADSLNLPETDFQSLLYGLSPAQRRLFLLLAEEGVASTIEVRQRCSIGNVSFCAIELNAKLEAAGDPRRVLCERREHANRHGERGQLGWWRLVSLSSPANDSTTSPAESA
jgi:hypothetical protein